MLVLENLRLYKAVCCCPASRYLSLRALEADVVLVLLSPILRVR